VQSDRLNPRKEGMMSLAALERRFLPKPWGRRVIPAGFGAVRHSAEPLGEVWFESGCGADPVLIKYLFTSQRLSIQVHPGEAAAGELGLPFGKDEAWVILDAQPGAKIGLGLKRPVCREELREAAESGTIEELVNWRPARAGDVIYSPAGTIHALGPGLTLVEIQQNVDVTYRLYDYGRGRELHLDAAIAAADLQPFAHHRRPITISAHRKVLAQGAKFVVERWTGGDQVLDASPTAPVWLVPLTAGGRVDEERLEPGQAYVMRHPARLRAAGELLIAYAGSAVRFANAFSRRRAA
jgi:mannose-6-phosphate isomerase